MEKPSCWTDCDGAIHFGVQRVQSLRRTVRPTARPVLRDLFDESVKELVQKPLTVRMNSSYALRVGPEYPEIVVSGKGLSNPSHGDVARLI